MQIVIKSLFREADRLESRKLDIQRGNIMDYTPLNLMVDTMMARACAKAIVSQGIYRTPAEKRSANMALKRLVNFSYELPDVETSGQEQGETERGQGEPS